MIPSLCLLCLVIQEPVPEPPEKGKPATFRGAIGHFRVKAEASPTSVVVGSPIRFTIRIQAEPGVPVLAPPTRPEVEKDPEFTSRFKFEKPEPASKKEDGKPVWEFYYRLIPISEKVTEIPEMPFCFFDPRFGSDPRGYQEPFTKAIAITVTPKPREAPKVEETGLAEYPDVIRWIAEEDAILQRHHPWTLPDTGWLVALLGIPPLAALGWLLVWRRLYPDAAHLAKRRRSRAAREALKALHTVRGDQGGKLAERVAEVVTRYLCQRFDLSTAAPTPLEVDAFLRSARLSDNLREQATSLLQTCDALRFSAIPPAVSGSLAETAEKLILDLEAHSWSLLLC